MTRGATRGTNQSINTDEKRGRRGEEHGPQERFVLKVADKLEDEALPNQGFKRLVAGAVGDVDLLPPYFLRSVQGSSRQGIFFPDRNALVLLFL